MFVIIVISFLLFYIWMRFGNTKANLIIQREKEEFLNNEYRSNSVRKVDISGLDYIKIPIDKLPLKMTDEKPLQDYQNTILNLSDKPILNLTGISNTDLKLKYGTANITFLSECDNNFTLLASTLYKWGLYQYNNSNIYDAITILEYGINCKTDVIKNYTLLANIYKSIGTPEKIKELIKMAETLNSISKNLILKELNKD